MDIIIHSAESTLLPITLAFSLLALWIIGWGLILGLFRGIHRSAIRLISVVAAAVISFFIARPSAPSFNLIFKLASLVDIDLLTFPVALRNSIVGYISAITAPFVFLGIFILLNILFYIVYLIVAFCAFPRKKYKPKDGSKGLKRHRLAGMLVSAVAGVLMIACFNLPFYGYSNLVTNEFSEILEPFSDTVEFEDTNGVHDVISRYTLGELAFNNLTTVKINGSRVSVARDMGDMADAAVNVMAVSSVPVNEWGEDERESVERVFEVVKESETLTDLVCSGAEFAVAVIKVPEEYEDALSVPEIPERFEEPLIGLFTNLSDKESGAFERIIDVTSDIVLALADGMKRTGSAELSPELLVEDEAMLYDLLNTILCSPDLDGITVAAVDMGLEAMAKELAVAGEMKVDGEAWSSCTVDERAAEAKLLSEVVPELLSVAEGEDGDSKMTFNAAGTMVKLKDSKLVGPLANRVVVAVAGSYLTDMIKNSGISSEGGEGNVGEITEELPGLLEDGEIGSGMMDALPEIVENAELDDEDVEALREVVDGLDFDEEQVDAIPDYLKDFLKDHGIEIKANKD
ncbi:MAG: hypothetical protein IJN63_00810 [Clostridia bacterium]|nr:hypothetical protein [Clostridia bacterium]